MEVDLTDLVCSECGNKQYFYWDSQVGETVCEVCGVVVEEVIWRLNYFDRV